MSNPSGSNPSGSSSSGSDSSGKSYYTPVPEIFARLLQQAINQQLQGGAENTAKLANLGEDSIGLELKGTGIELFFFAADQQLKVTAKPRSRVATWIRGTPVALFGMANPDWARAGSKVIIEGDATLVRDFEALLSGLDFDWEQKVSEMVGEVAAHQIGLAVKTLGGFAKKLSTLGNELGGDSIRKLVESQADEFTSREQMAEFSEQVQAFAKSVDEVATRLQSKAGET